MIESFDIVNFFVLKKIGYCFNLCYQKDLIFELNW